MCHWPRYRLETHPRRHWYVPGTESVCPKIGQHPYSSLHAHTLVHWMEHDADRSTQGQEEQGGT